MKKQEVIEQIKTNNLGSIYSKEDVIRLLEQIDSEPAELRINSEIMSSITDKINDYLENMDTSDLIDYDSACFNIGYHNRLELESVDSNISIDESEIIRMIKEAFEENDITVLED
jgi:hypothetical protein